MPWAAAQARGSPAGRAAQDLPAGADCLGRRPCCPRGLPLAFLHGGVLRLQSFVPRMDAELKALGHSKLLGQGPPTNQRPPTGWRPRAQVAAPDPFFRKQALAGAGPISASSLLSEQKPSLDSSGVVVGRGVVLESRRESGPSAPALSPPQVTAPLARPPTSAGSDTGVQGRLLPSLSCG